MKKYYIALLSVVSTLALFGFTQNTELRLWNENSAQYRYVLKVPETMTHQQFVAWLEKNNFDIAGVNLHAKTIEVITDSKGLLNLKENKVMGFIKAQDLGVRRMTALDTKYFTPQTLEKRLKEIAAQYPKVTRLEQIGTSHEGRAIWALLVSSTPNDEAELKAKPSILVDGMHHAREVMTTEVVEGLAEKIIDAQLDSENPMHELAQRWSFWFIPMLNVDGNNIVWTKNAWWRKNAQSDGGSVHGVDINRNYPYKWNGCGGSSGSKTSDIYRGVSPGSEKEVKGIDALAKAIRPTAYLSFHSYGELILYPYGCRGEQTGENELLAKIAKELQNILPSDSSPEQKYTPGKPWEILYGVDGDSAGHMYAEYGSLAYTYEINEQFQPSYSLKPATLAKHYVAFQYLMNRMEKNLLAIKVIDGKTSEPLQAKVGISTIAHVKGEKPFQTNSDGYFFKVLDPGSYSLTIQSSSGANKTLQIQMNGSQEIEVAL